MGRMIQHEVDHLDGVLLVEHLDEDQAKEAEAHPPGRSLLGLPDADLVGRGSAGARPAPGQHGL